MDRQEALKKLRESMKIKVEIDMGEFFPYLDEEPYVHYYDSLSVEPDSALMVYRMKNIVRSDTLYEGLRMVVRDTLAADRMRPTLYGVKVKGESGRSKWKRKLMVEGESGS